MNGQISSYYYTIADTVSIGRAMLCKDMLWSPLSPSYNPNSIQPPRGLSHSRIKGIVAS